MREAWDNVALVQRLAQRGAPSVTVVHGDRDGLVPAQGTRMTAPASAGSLR